MISNPITPATKVLPSAPTTIDVTPSNIITVTKPKINPVALQHKESTLSKQEREPWARDYSPLQIRFLTGAYKGQLLEIGFNVKEFSTSQTAEWEKGKNISIRQGHNFNSISPRTFNFTLEYWALNEDVQQLVENNAHLHEITDNSVTPPKMQFAFGVTLIDPLICTSFTFKYDTPLPGNKGFRHGTVDLVFDLDGGAGTKHQLAPPLAPTPLADYKSGTTRVQREIQGTISVAVGQLAPCLSVESNAKIGAIFANNKLGDPTEIAALPADSFINLAFAGSISKEMLNRPEILEKLKNDLAGQLAIKEDGILPQLTQNLAAAIISGDGSALPSDFNLPIVSSTESEDASGKIKVIAKTQTLFEGISADYQAILTAIQKQELSSDSPIFKATTGTTAIQRISAIAKCGISLRKVGAPKVADVQGDAAVLLAGINNAIALAKDDEEIKKIFHLDPSTAETVVRKLKNGQPYKTKESFLADSSYNQMGITGVILWSTFSQQETAVLADVNTFLLKEGVTDDEIKKKFGVDDKQLIAIKNGGKAFASKEEFLKAISLDPNVNYLQGKGNNIWRNFEITE